MKSAYKALVIGSGFGGAVAACRLAQAGQSVGVLERGKDYRTTPFPRNFGDPQEGWFWAVRRGLLDVKPVGEMLIVQGAGLGGGSLIYSNVQMRPPPDTFAQGWPTGYTRAGLDPYRADRQERRSGDPGSVQLVRPLGRRAAHAVRPPVLRRGRTALPAGRIQARGAP